MIRIKSIEIHGKVTDYKALEKLVKLTQSNDIKIDKHIHIYNCKNKIKITKSNNVDRKLNRLRERIKNIAGVKVAVHINTEKTSQMKEVNFQDVKLEYFFFYTVDKKRLAFKKEKVYINEKFEILGVIYLDNDKKETRKFDPLDKVYIHE